MKPRKRPSEAVPYRQNLQSYSEGQEMFYAGLDLGSKRTRVHVRDAKGTAIYSGWAHDLAELKKTVGRWGQELSVTFEATTGAFFLYDELRDLVKEVKVAHPRDLRAIAHARIKNDRLDAEKLSELARGDLIPTVWVPSAKMRDERELLLGRARLRREIRVAKVKMRALLRRWGRGTAVEKPWTQAGLEAVAKLTLPTGAKYVLDLKIEQLQQLREMERKLGGEVRARIPMGEREKWLETIPGGGEDTARALANVMGEVSRFPDGRHVASYFGLVPSERTSCTEPRRGGITKEGSAWMRWLLIQCAWAAIRSTKKDPKAEWATMYAQMAARGKSKKRAIVAVANRLARVAYAVLRDRRAYEARPPRQKEEVPEKRTKIYELKPARPSTPSP